MIDKVNIQHCLKVLNLEMSNNLKEMSSNPDSEINWLWHQLCIIVGELTLLNQKLEKNGNTN